MKEYINKYIISSVIISLFIITNCDSPISSEEKVESKKEVALVKTNPNSEYPIAFAKGCGVAKLWVKRHINDLPSDLDAISAFPKNYQKAIYNKLGSTIKYRLWKEHLSRVLRNFQLTKLQVKSLKYVIQKLSPSFFEKEDATNSKVVFNQEQFLATFGKDLGSKIFTSLNPINPSSISNYLLFDTNITTTFVDPPPECNCQTDDSWYGCAAPMGPEMDCHENDYNCYDDGKGCGFLWASDCNGMCGIQL